MAKDSTEYFVVRHGLTWWNAERRIQGHIDTDLSDTGRAQAEAVASRLENEDFDFIYSSDLKRAKQTADPIARIKGLPLVTDKRLREWHLGAFEGLTVDEAKVRFGDTYSRYRSFDATLQIPEGECFLDFDRRVMDYFTHATKNHPNQTLLVFTHGGVVNVMLRHLLGIPLTSREKFFIPNTSVTRVRAELSASGLQWSLAATDVELLHPGLLVTEPRGDV